MNTTKGTVVGYQGVSGGYRVSGVSRGASRGCQGSIRVYNNKRIYKGIGPPLQRVAQTNGHQQRYEVDETGCTPNLPPPPP